MQIRERKNNGTLGAGRRFGFVRGLVYSAALVFALHGFSEAIHGQTDTRPTDAPPPMRVMSKTERDELEKNSGVRSRTQSALRLMEARMKNAESLNAKGDSSGVFAQLGAFHAIIDDTLDFLGANEKMTRTILNNFKRFEIGLRKFTPRLELVRRGLPSTHREYVVTLLKHLRDARTRATDSLYSDTVLRIDDTD